MQNRWPQVPLTIETHYGRRLLSVSPFMREAAALFQRRGVRRVLDMGCGYGRHAFFLREAGFDVMAADVDADAVAWLGEQARLNGLHGLGAERFGLTDIPYPDGSFDAVVCLSVLHHATVAQIQTYFTCLRRALRDGGFLVFDMLSVEDASYGVGELIEPGTFVGSREGEEDIPHHYTTPDEIARFASGFSSLSLTPNEYVLDMPGAAFRSRVYDGLACKESAATA